MPVGGTTMDGSLYDYVSDVAHDCASEVATWMENVFWHLVIPLRFDVVVLGKQSNPHFCNV